MSQNSHTHGIPAITGSIDYESAIHLFPESLQKYRSSTLAYGSSIIATTVGFPLDTVKTRMQTYKNFTSYLDCIYKTYKGEGITAFFRGIWAPLLTSSISRSISIGIFTNVKPQVYDSICQFVNPSKIAHPLLTNIPVCIISGSIAGAGVSIIACPFEFTKVYAQISSIIEKNSAKDLPSQAQSIHRLGNKPSTIEIARQITKYKGFKGLYSGFRYHFFRDSIGTGAYYSIYESVKWSISNLFEYYNISTNKQLAISLAGGLSGSLSWIFVFPVDTAKSLIQKDIVTNIIRRQSGLQEKPLQSRNFKFIDLKMFRGLGISMTRSFVVSMMFFSFYEYSMSHLV